MNDIVLTQAEKHLFDAKEGNLGEFMNWIGMMFPITVTEEELIPLMGQPQAAGELVMKRIEEAYKAKCASEDQQVLPFMERGVFLDAIDRQWQDYLRAMDDLRHGVNLRAYGQRDPLIEYKKEAFEMFESLMTTIKSKVVSSEFRSATISRMRTLFGMMSQNAAHTNQDEISIEASTSGAEPSQANASPAPAASVADVFASMMSSSRAGVAAPVSSQAAAQTTGRNDPCPCGSGKKYKKCCGRNAL
jgi:preprotein translocase subunit SecA